MRACASLARGRVALLASWLLKLDRRCVYVLLMEMTHVSKVSLRPVVTPRVGLQRVKDLNSDVKNVTVEKLLWTTDTTQDC